MIPRVSVLMSVYNGAAYLGRTLESLLGQTLGEIEIVVMDDGSTDGTRDLLQGFAAVDPRVRPARNSRNLGQPASLNRGLELLRGELIARNDADDLALPERLARQAAFLDARPEVVMVGCQASLIDDQERPLGAAAPYPLSDAGIRALMLASIAFCGPAIMFRRGLVQEGGLRFDPATAYAEDYDFCSRAMAHGRLANLPQTLLAYRVHQASISQKNTERQEDLAEAIAWRNIQNAGLDRLFPREDLALLRAWDVRTAGLNHDQLARQWLLMRRFLDLLQGRLRVGFLDRAIIRRRLLAKLRHSLAILPAAARPPLLLARVSSVQRLASLAQRGAWLLNGGNGAGGG